MPFNLDQLEFLRVSVGVAIPPEFIENKRREATFKKRSEELAAREVEIKARTDGATLAGLLETAKAAATTGDFATALKSLDELEAGLAAPDLPPPLPVPPPSPVADDEMPPPSDLPLPPVPAQQEPDQQPVDAERKRFDERWAVLEPKIEKVTADIGSGVYGGTPPSGKLQEPAEDFTRAKNKLGKARETGDFAAANKELDESETAMKALEEAFTALNKKDKYLAEKAKFQDFDRLAKAVAENNYGNPPHKDFEIAVSVFSKGKKKIDDGEAAGNFVQAGAGLQVARAAPFANCVKTFDARWQKAKAETDKIADSIDKGSYAGKEGAIKTFKDARTSTADAVARAKSQDFYGAARAAIDALEETLKTFRASVAKQMTGQTDEPAETTRAKALSLLKQDPELAKALVDQPGGSEMLDKIVEDLKGSAKDPQTKEFVRAAIKARFGSDLTDKDLTTKYLPRLYKVLGMVPASHTKENPKLKTINRTRTKIDTSGDYLDGKINLNAPRTGLVDSLVSFGATLKPGQLGGLGISQFDVLTLHEVGHAVDDARGFMNGKKGAAKFGGWNKPSVDEVADAVGTGKGFYKDHSKLPRAFLKSYLLAVLEKRDPATDAKVTANLEVGKPAPNWKTLGKHAAVKCCENIRLQKGDEGLWDGGDSAASKNAIGDWVFQESYKGDWVSYARSARKQKISDYQFRADGEWYAEAYAAFFVGKLPKSHPLHVVLETDRSAAPPA